MEIPSVFKAISEPARLRLLFILRDGAMNVGELTELLGLSQPTVSHHLRTLERAGLIRARKEGTWVYYQLAEEVAQHPVFIPLLFSPETLNKEPSLRTLIEGDRLGIDRILNRRRERSLDFFESAASSWETLLEDFPSYELSLTKVAESIDPQLSCLELGCGVGTLLKRLLPRPGVTIAVDQSQAMLKEAESALRAVQEVDLRLGRLEHLPLGDETVDVAVSHMVFHHLPEPQAALRDVFRVLKPGGRLVLCDLVKHDREMMRERYADLWLGFHVEEFQSWLSEAGFTEVETEFVGEQQESFLLQAVRAKKEKEENND